MTANAEASPSFYDAKTRARVASVISGIERQTAAEIVVAVRPNSGFYRHADYLFGFALAFADLLLFLFHPRSMRVETFPFEALGVFVLGALVSAWVPPLRRALVRRSLLGQNVDRAARATFVELGVSRTRQRTGILVYVSLFERAVRVVSDLGVVEAELGDSWQRAKGALESVLVPAPSVERFTSALAALGQPLAHTLPVQPDDVNELSDEASVE